MYEIFSNMFAPILKVVYGVIYGSLIGALLIILLSFIYFCIKYKIKPYKLDKQLKKLESLHIKFKIFDFLRWIMYDWGNRNNWIDNFNEYGFTFFVGPQGSGKTISLVDYLNRMHIRHPKTKIVTNFKYKFADHIITDWKELLTFRNGEDGVIFAFDEMQNEWNTTNWRDMPPSIISTVSMQRKQFVKIVACSQVFNAVAKPLRDQCFTVIVCETFFKRWTFTREYDYFHTPQHLLHKDFLKKFELKIITKTWVIIF
jgi:ATP-dependent Clp protease ATP-binding subunit ClpX